MDFQKKKNSTLTEGILVNNSVFFQLVKDKTFSVKLIVNKRSSLACK